MKHRLFGKKLGRNHNERQALFRVQTRSFLTYGSIKTTQAKARAVTPLIERLVSSILASNDLVGQRLLSPYFQKLSARQKIYNYLKELFPDQHSNFTHMENLVFRQGDHALMVKLAFVKSYQLPSSAPSKVPAKAQKVTAKATKSTAKKVTSKKESK
ncbi:MAG: L17 family ribosomal protein [Candidatus Shapirobacteria bacterium]|jgi:large subunit ribosomal protein L17